MPSPKFHPAWAPAPGSNALFDRTPHMAGAGALPAPVVYAADEASLRLRELTHVAKRLVDMAFVSGLGWDEAMQRMVLNGMPAPGPLTTKPDAAARQAVLQAAWREGHISILPDLENRRVSVTWMDAEFGGPLSGAAEAPPGWGGVVLGEEGALRFTPFAIPRQAHGASRAWPLGDAVEVAGMQDSDFEETVARFFAKSPGAYGLLVASPDQVLYEAYGEGGAPDRVTPSWSVNKSMTGSLIGRMIQLGWLEGVHMPAPAPLWRDPRGIHSLITIDHLMTMRSGLGMANAHGGGVTSVGFENTAVYTDGADCFVAAQSSIVATRPGSVFRYVNSGINVLGAILRDRIERRGLPYHQTLYELLPDKLGMGSYTFSADIVGNLVASGSAFSTLRDYAKHGVLYLNDGVWDGERLLPEGWVDYALSAKYAGTSYAATFWTNSLREYPALPPDAAWMAGSGDQKVFILRGSDRVVAVSNEADRPLDSAALNEVLGAVVDLA